MSTQHRKHADASGAEAGSARPAGLLRRKPPGSSGTCEKQPEPFILGSLRAAQAAPNDKTRKKGDVNCCALARTLASSAVLETGLEAEGMLGPWICRGRIRKKVSQHTAKALGRSLASLCEGRTCSDCCGLFPQCLSSVVLLARPRLYYDNFA